jgi:tRNA threonylcarbamoyladenosine biosynthesis protein TsaE
MLNKIAMIYGSNMEIYESKSAKETGGFGEKLARSIQKTGLNSRAATIITLHGDLGAGKTTFTQGFACGLGIKRRLISPTFVIMRRYAIPVGKGRVARRKFKNLYHIDAYRLKNPDGLETLGLAAIFSDPMAIVLIEWPENIKKLLKNRAKETLKLKFEYGKKENERRIIMSG